METSQNLPNPKGKRTRKLEANKLPALSKVIERLILEILKETKNEKKILPDKQMGFMASTNAWKPGPGFEHIIIYDLGKNKNVNGECAQVEAMIHHEEALKYLKLSESCEDGDTENATFRVNLTTEMSTGN